VEGGGCTDGGKCGMNGEIIKCEKENDVGREGYSRWLVEF